MGSALNVNFQLSSPECSIAPSLDAWTLKWALTMLLPVFAAVCIALVALLFCLLRKWTVREVADGARRTWVQAMALLYLPLTAGAFSLFGCRRDGSGHWIITDQPSRFCYDARWWRLFVPALLCALLYGLALPALLFGALARVRRTLSPVAFVIRFGFLVGRFTDSFWFFEVANMLTKLGVSSA
eukprot:c41200_g1_i1.p1 GENE.c41200_g1_i1~~c41200_g1_i1.p1  ORF type:complete len:184 (-),score=23.27 c41200_g1_i1:243-794(-)